MGSKGYSTGAHVVFKLTVHLVFVTKYRRKVITERVFEIMREAWSSVCQKLECELMEANFEPDHVHLLVAYPTKVSIASLVQRLKGLSSRRVRARTRCGDRGDRAGVPGGVRAGRRCDVIARCRTCGAPASHITAGCAECRERAEDNAHVAARASGLTCPTSCGVCAALRADEDRARARNPWVRRG